jgi:hypothetical protein
LEEHSQRLSLPSEHTPGDTETLIADLAADLVINILAEALDVDSGEIGCTKLFPNAPHFPDA